jgi:ABC-type sugar transport system substrate-binding protein
VKKLIPVLGLSVVLVTAGCGASEDEPDAGQADAQAKQAHDLTIGVSNLGLSFPFPAAISKGIKAEAQKLGVKVVELDAKGDTNKQADDVQDLIAQKPDGILLLPLDSGVAQGLVSSISGAGIPVVAVASQVGDPKTVETGREVFPKLDAIVTQDEVAAGAKAGELATKLLPSGGKVAVVEGQAGFAEVRTRMTGFKKALDDSGQNFDIVASQPGDWLPDKGEAACQNMLAANPGIGLVYAQADDMAAGCAKAVKAADSDAKIIGIGGNKLVINDIKRGDVAGTVCYKPEDMGALAIRTIVQDLTGEKPLDQEFISYDTPAITQSNVDDCTPQW